METLTTINYKNILVATGGALVANALVFAIANAAGASWDVGQPFKVGIAMVLAATAVPMLLGGFVAKLAAAKWSKALSIFAWGVLIFTIVGAPSGWAASGETATGIALGLMHVVVGIAWFLALKAKNNK